MPPDCVLLNVYLKIVIPFLL